MPLHLRCRTGLHFRPNQPSSGSCGESCLLCTFFPQASSSLYCVFFRQEELAGRGQEGGRHLQPLEILSFSVENHPEFPRQKEATTFCLLFLEFLFFSEQLIKDLRTAARKPFPLQNPQLCSQCAGCPLHRGQRHILLLEAERSGPMVVTLERLHLQIYLWCRS